jgi:hypothetical protein
VLDAAVTRLFPAETTDPAVEATALSVPVFTLALAAVTLEPCFAALSATCV